jgi:hypothetical protein
VVAEPVQAIEGPPKLVIASSAVVFPVPPFTIATIPVTFAAVPVILLLVKAIVPLAFGKVHV